MKNNIKIQVIIQVCLVVISFLLGGLFMLILMEVKPVKESNNIVKSDTIVHDKNSLAKAINKVYDAVVAIEGYNGREKVGTGAGFVYRTDDKYGYILTNEHVITDATKVDVTMSNDEKVTAIELGNDKYLDLAVLKIDKKYIKNVVTIGNSEKMNLGDTIFAIGSPMGIEYRGSVTSGIISGKDRLVSTTTSKGNTYDWVMKVIQIDAPLNPGNSGGPLLNTNGDVIGVCTMKLIDDSIEGMGFAIPIEYAMSHIKTLEDSVKIKWPTLGVGMKDVTDANLQINDVSLPEDQRDGVIITNVKNGSSAFKADLKVGDVITKMNNKTIKNTAYLRYELYQHQAGEKVEITYIRDKKEKKVTVTLDS